MTQEQIDISGLKTGKEDVWRSLFLDYYAVMCHLAMQYVRDKFTAEAIVSDIFYHLWDRRRNLPQIRSARQYLFTIVRNECLNYLESSKVRNTMFISSFRDNEIDSILLEEMPEVGKLLELSGQVEKAVDKIPEQSRKVFEKSRREGKQYKEIAEELGISVNTVKYHIKQALSILRDELGAAGLASFAFMLIFTTLGTMNIVI